MIGHHGDKPRQYDKSRYGGFIKEIKEIVKYANKRGINDSEIEMPGHSQAAVASYPMLDVSEQVGVAPLWGVFKEIYLAKMKLLIF